MKRRLERIGACLAALLLCACCAAAEDASAIQATAGYDGTVFGGRSVPVDVTVTAGGEAINGVLSVDVRVQYEEYDRFELPVELGAGETKQFHFSVLPQMTQASYDVQLTSGGALLAACSVPVAQTIPEQALIIGIVGGDSTLAQVISGMERTDVRGREQAVCALAAEAQQIMRTQQELDAFDVLVLPQSLSGLGLSAQQQAMLDTWEQTGGVCVRDAWSALPRHEHAERLYARIAELVEEKGTRLVGGSNFSYSYSLAQNARIGRGESLMPAALLLGAYAIAAGAGLFVLLRRRDRSGWLWAAIPASAALCAALVACMGAQMELHSPLSSSLRVTYVDENGKVTAEEMALLSTSSQEPVTVSTAAGDPVRRMEYVSFNSWNDGDVRTKQRDTIAVDDQPSITLSPRAAWYVQTVVIDSGAVLEGEIGAEAMMEADGLHMTISNQTDILLEDAVLVTALGYARLGDIPAGETRRTVIARQETPLMDGNGDFVIEEGKLLPYQKSLYTISNACVYPEAEADRTFRISSLSDEERYRREQLSSRLQHANGHNGQQLPCALVALTPELACADLLIDGESAARSAAGSVLVREIPLAPASPSGYFYIPQDGAAMYAAALDEDGKPRRSKQIAPGSGMNAQQAYFGYVLEDAGRAQSLEIRIFADYLEGTDARLEIYDHERGEWASPEPGRYVRIAGDDALRYVNDAGEMFLRCSGEGETYIAPPAVQAEGVLAEEAEESEEGSE